ncbi:MAG: RluA family pseudouridine synthase [Bacteroidota bacterium]|nr:RluA family pseudouridine synthase [Bacteroidota bacterium]
MKVIFEDEYVIAVEKIAGLQVEPDRKQNPSVQENLQDFLKETKSLKKNSFIFPLFRLDRPVSGLLLFSKNISTFKLIQKQIALRAVEKSYYAVVLGSPTLKSQRLIHFLEKDPKKFKSLVHEDTKSGTKEAVLEYDTLEIKDGFGLLKIQLHTGRYHQIRAQLSHVNLPVWNDVLYNSQKYSDDIKIGLHCESFGFLHPGTQKRLTLQCPVPKELPWNIFSFS